MLLWGRGFYLPCTGPSQPRGTQGPGPRLSSSATACFSGEKSLIVDLALGLTSRPRKSMDVARLASQNVFGGLDAHTVK